MASSSVPNAVSFTGAPKKESKTVVADSTPAVKINLDTNLLTMANPNDFSYILKETGNRLLVVEFFAKWCGPCTTLSSKLEEIANAYNGKILVVKIDVDEFEDLTAEHNVLAIPTIVLIKNQSKLEQFSSSCVNTLGKHLEKHVGKPSNEATEKQEHSVAGKLGRKQKKNSKNKSQTSIK